MFERRTGASDSSGKYLERRRHVGVAGSVSQEGVVEWLELVRLEPQEIVLPIKEETVDAVTLIPRERVQQWTAEQIGDVPQFREETVDEETLVPRERVQQWTAEQIRDVPHCGMRQSTT